MFGSYIRAALTAGASVLFASVLQFIVNPMLPMLGAEDSLLFRTFDAVTEYALLIMIVAVGAAVIARAVTESNAGRV